jgi:hypothetical protein
MTHLSAFLDLLHVMGVLYVCHSVDAHAPQGVNAPSLTQPTQTMRHQVLVAGTQFAFNVHGQFVRADPMEVREP